MVDRNFVFQVHERDVFRKILRQVEGFSGVKVLTWTILSNHFHVLVEVPPVPGEPLTDEEILARCRSLYPPERMVELEWEFGEARRQGGTALERLRQRYLVRMWDLSQFMKTLKQKFTLWFNREHARVGTLWESRFKCVLVEGDWRSLLCVAAYIDLNAVRAGLVEDPKDYRWCGYAEAVAGEGRARSGLAAVMRGGELESTWRDIGPRYRRILFGIGEESPLRKGISREEVAAVWACGGELTLAQLLRCRVRYFSDGLAIGSRAFVDGVFASRRSYFGPRRTTGARNLAGGEGWGELMTIRALRKDALRPPPPEADR